MKNLNPALILFIMLSGLSYGQETTISPKESAADTQEGSSPLLQTITAESSEQPQSQVISSENTSKEVISTQEIAAPVQAPATKESRREQINDKEAQQDEATSKDTTNIVKSKNTQFDDIDILADSELRSYFIFVDEFNESDESIKEIIEERDLARDEFLMQNIDREEFEQERILLMFKNKDEGERRRTYGVLKVTSEDFKPATEEDEGSVETLNPEKAN